MAAPPDPPVATVATQVTDKSFKANWEAAAGATGYELDVAKDAGFSTLVEDALALGNVLTHTLEQLDAKKSYFYRVRATNDDGETDNSNVIMVSTAAAPVLENLQGVMIQHATDDLIVLSNGQNMTVSGNRFALSTPQKQYIQ